MLASAKIKLDTQRSEVQKVVDGAKSYQQEISGKIATLTAKQSQAQYTTITRTLTTRTTTETTTTGATSSATRS
jgi:hypothetical protein